MKQQNGRERWDFPKQRGLQFALTSLIMKVGDTVPRPVIKRILKFRQNWKMGMPLILSSFIKTSNSKRID